MLSISLNFLIQYGIDNIELFIEYVIDNIKFSTETVIDYIVIFCTKFFVENLSIPWNFAQYNIEIILSFL